MKVESWFDTKYYHILYKDRDYAEANYFMTNLMNFFKLSKTSSLLDLACGRGRHSIFLNKMGYQVMGVDISESSIAFAKKFETPSLHFQVQDMRFPIKGKYHIILNLFTSFGYFNMSDNQAVLQSIKGSLDDDGYAVIDYLNPSVVISNLVRNEVKEVDGICFHLKRYRELGYIYKDISFRDEGKDYNFKERVSLIGLEGFKNLYKKVGLELVNVFGDYSFSEFREKISERLIMIIK